MVTRRRQFLAVLCGGFSPLAGCLGRRSGDGGGGTRRGVDVDGYLIPAPPDDAPVTRYGTDVESESQLLEAVMELLVDTDGDVPHRFERREYLDVRRGTLDRDPSDVPYVWVESREYPSDVGEAVDVLEDLPEYRPSEDEDDFYRGVHLQFEGEYIRFQYEVRWTTPGPD